MNDVKGSAEGCCDQFQSWLHVLEITDDIDFNGSLRSRGRRLGGGGEGASLISAMFICTGRYLGYLTEKERERERIGSVPFWAVPRLFLSFMVMYWRSFLPWLRHRDRRGVRLNTPYVKYPGVLIFNIQSFKNTSVLNFVENPLKPHVNRCKGFAGKRYR